MHYGASPVGNRKLRKTHLGFYFLAIHIFQTDIFEISFTFVWYLGTSWNPSQQQQNFNKNQLEFQQACWRMWKSERTSWKDSWIKSRKYFWWSSWEQIFGKYLHIEGLPGEFYCFLVFFSAQPHCSTHQISESSDQPFMFFANKSTNIWLIW